ncbi:MAG: hypothetical protein HKN49_09310 [Gammaproteobacteria bacterium]|nr:hypothetical protein [Gammaproteobacteria bacterium]
MMDSRLTGMMLGLLCIGCVTQQPVAETDPGSNGAEEFVPTEVVIVQMPETPPTERSKADRCVRRAPVGSRIARTECVTAEQRKKRGEFGRRVVEGTAK